MEVLRSSSSVAAAFHFLAGGRPARRLATLSSPLQLPRSPSRTLFDASRQRLLRIRIVSRVAFLHDPSENSRRVLSTWSDKDLARAVLFSFLGRKGTHAGTIADLDHVAGLLASKLQPLRGSVNPAGIEFTVVQLEDALTPYLESLLKKRREDVCTDVAEKPPGPLAGSEVASATSLLRKQAIAELDRQLQEGILPPYALYLMSVGLNLDQIRKVTLRAPNISIVRVDRRLQPFVEFLLGLGVDQSDLPCILRRDPRLMCFSIENILMPTVAFLENLCVDRSQWAMILHRYPSLLVLSRRKLEENVSYFLKQGGCNEYLRKLVTQCPQILAMRIDGKIKSTNEFLLDKGFTIEEIRMMTLKLPTIYCFNIAKTLIPKWEFFLVMGYPQSKLTKFPQYFCYSLKNRIMPRYKLATELGVQIPLNVLLTTSSKRFGRLLEGRLRKCG